MLSVWRERLVKGPLVFRSLKVTSDLGENSCRKRSQRDKCHALPQISPTLLLQDSRKGGSKLYTFRKLHNGTNLGIDIDQPWMDVGLGQGGKAL